MNPYLEAIIELNPDAVTIAANLDDERRRGIVRGTLHGIPVLVKDVRPRSLDEIFRLIAVEHIYQG